MQQSNTMATLSFENAYKEALAKWNKSMAEDPLQVALENRSWGDVILDFEAQNAPIQVVVSEPKPAWVTVPKIRNSRRQH